MILDRQEKGMPHIWKNPFLQNSERMGAREAHKLGLVVNLTGHGQEKPYISFFCKTSLERQG
jgi:hypothetical protein